jgi:dTDP-4-amino-4,6-dideoxygalactose transaminase
VNQETTAPAAVPFFDNRESFEREWPDLQRHLHEVFDHGKYSHGRKTEELEEAVKRFTGARHAIGVNSGTDALLLLLRAAGVGPGDEVVLPCYTFFASASAVHHVGARPVFVDIDPETYALDLDAVREAITDRTRAIMPVHLFNQMADMASITEIAARSGIPVVEDSAEAIGMFHGGVHAGLLGLGGVLSFFPTKTLGALGDAGMVITDDPLVADRCAVLRHHGRMGVTVGRISGISNAASISGTNSKMDEVQAAVLLTRLARLNQAIARRAELARYYDERLADVAQIRRPVLKPGSAATNPVWYVYLVEADDRDALADFLAGKGIGTEIYYPRPLHLQPCFASLGHRPHDFPVAERVAGRALALPLYPDLTPAQADRVCQAIEEFYARGAR